MSPMLRPIHPFCKISGVVHFTSHDRPDALKCRPRQQQSPSLALLTENRSDQVIIEVVEL